MSGSVLQQIVDLVRAKPHGAAALTLYALVSTLEFEKAGYLFKLDKLKDLSAEERQLAYQLMELMVAGEVGSADWQNAKSAMDEAVRAG